jgi:hypothetical protein
MTTFTGFEVSFRSFSTDVAAKMAISSLFSLDTGGSAFALLFDALLHDDTYERVDLDSGVSYIKRRGCGLRVAMKATQLDMKQAVTFASVAAQASLGLADVEYRVHGIGLSTEVIESLLAIPIEDKLSAQAYQAMHTAIQQKLPAYLMSNSVGAGEYVVPLASNVDDPSEQARAVNYAVSRVAQKTPLAQALKSKPAGVSEAVIAAIYARLASSSPENVTAAQADSASRWLASGNT